ncbi:MAG: hypothetical protein HFG69_01505 [Hungatella sp.]|nr:hypothetical protein [Hungatella sp.]
MLEFLETGKALYVLAAVCALGLMGRLVARNLYKRLTKETDNMTLTKNRYLRELKQKTENTYRLNQGIRNSRVYLEKQLGMYRFLGMTLSGWGSFGGQMTIMCFLLGGAASFGAYWYRCDSYYIVLYGSVGILAGLFTMAADYWANLSERRMQLLNALQDYMENSLINRLVRETATTAEDTRHEPAKPSPLSRSSIRTLDRREDNLDDQDFIGRNLEELSQAEYAKSEDSPDKKRQPDRMAKDRNRPESRKEPEEESIGRAPRRTGRTAKRVLTEPETKEPETGRRDIDYLKNSLEQIAASRERSRADSDWIKDLSSDELELVGQILKQYLG